MPCGPRCPDWPDEKGRQCADLLDNGYCALKAEGNDNPTDEECWAKAKADVIERLSLEYGEDNPFANQPFYI